MMFIRYLSVQEKRKQIKSIVIVFRMNKRRVFEHVFEQKMQREIVRQVDRKVLSDAINDSGEGVRVLRVGGGRLNNEDDCAYAMRQV